ncbi:unnamed protein product [Dicrocoelium dendriticum]|nr:unnamed protein product [Dicrocoelium dendriticum]
MTALMTFLSGPISAVSCGLLGKHALATVGLANSVFNVTCLAVVIGLLTAADTLFSQTYGSNEQNMLRIQLQRAIVIITFCCIPCISLYLFAEPVLLLLQQNPQTARKLIIKPDISNAIARDNLSKVAENTMKTPDDSHGIEDKYAQDCICYV